MSLPCGLCQVVFTSAESEIDQPTQSSLFTTFGKLVARSANRFNWSAPLRRTHPPHCLNDYVSRPAHLTHVRAADPSTREACIACHAGDQWHVISITPWSMTSSGVPLNVPQFLLTKSQWVLFSTMARDQMVPCLYYGHRTKRWGGTSPFPTRIRYRIYSQHPLRQSAQLNMQQERSPTSIKILMQHTSSIPSPFKLQNLVTIKQWNK